MYQMSAPKDVSRLRAAQIERPDPYRTSRNSKKLKTTPNSMGREPQQSGEISGFAEKFMEELTKCRRNERHVTHFRNPSETTKGGSLHEKK